MYILKEQSDIIPMKPKRIDLVIVLCFLLFASLYQVNRMAGNSRYLLLSSDSENVVSFAAAGEHPEFFSGDELLSNKQNFRFYLIIHLPLIKTISKFSGDYASAFLSLIGLHIFLQLLGFYILGFIIFQNRYWAVLLAIATLMHIPLAMGEFWGMYCEPLTRVSFQTILPYLLAAVFYFHRKPAVWPWLFVVIGIMMYIHSVSVPAWGLSIWLGMWLFLPSDWNLFKKIRTMFFLCVILILTVSPFFIHYLMNHTHGRIENYDTTFEIMKYRSYKGCFDIPLAFNQFFSNITFFRIFALGLIGCLFVWFYKNTERKKILVIWLWFIGILFTAVIIPLAEQAICRTYRIIPLETELVRNLRYLPPLMLIFCIWPFAIMAGDSLNRINKKVFFFIGTLLVLVWSSRQMYKHVVYLEKRGCFLFQPDKTNSAQTLDILNSLKTLSPTGSRVLSLASFSELAVRYHALRPLVYAGKDGGALYYNNQEELIRWYDKTKEIAGITRSMNSKLDDKTKMALLLELSRKFKAQFLLVNCNLFSEPFLKTEKNIVYQNNSYALIKINTY